MDAADFTRQVTAAERGLYRVAKTMLRSDADCADAVQEAILRAWQKRESLRQEEYFRTWLTRILINECRRLARKKPDTLPLEDVSALSSEDGAPVNAALREALLSLPLPLRVTVTLHYLEGYSVAETAKLTGVPPGTVKSRLSRARSALQKAMEDQL